MLRLRVTDRLITRMAQYPEEVLRASVVDRDIDPIKFNCSTPKPLNRAARELRQVGRVQSTLDLDPFTESFIWLTGPKDMLKGGPMKGKHEECRYMERDFRNGTSAAS